MGATVQRTYSLVEIETGLLELARWHGSPANAVSTLAEQGIEIPKETLQTGRRPRRPLPGDQRADGPRDQAQARRAHMS
jgi:hypothetical protein